MAVGLLIGIGFDPTPTDFEELLAKGALKQRDFQYVTAELSTDEARDRDQIREYYKAACANQNWLEGLKYAEDLKFSDVVVFGKPVLIVEPKGFDEPAPKTGAIIAGIGFTPAQADLEQLIKQIKVHQGWEYVLKSYSKEEASSEVILASAYIATSKKQGWADLKSPLSVQRREIDGKEFLLLQPSLPGEAKDEGVKEAQTASNSASEKIVDLFNLEKINPTGKKILAFAILFEREVAPAVWVGPGEDPYGVKGESVDARQARFYASKIVPGYQPHFIPAHLSIDKDTRTAGRRFQQDESMHVSHINPVLAGMLANLLPDQDLSRCSALSLSGESAALGKTRFAILVGDTTEKQEMVGEPVESEAGLVDEDSELTTDEDLEQIRTDLADPDKDVRQAAIGRLGEIGDERAIALLIATFKDDTLGVVWAAESTLAKIGSPAYEPVVAALNSRDPEIRKGAARTLGKLEDPQAVEPLIAAMKDSDKDVRMSVVTALGQIGDDRAVEPLCRALKDKWDVGVCAAEALCNYDDPRAVEPLIDAIKNEDWSLWRFAAKALGNIGDPRAVPVLNGLLMDSNEQISQAAAEALAAIELKQDHAPAVSTPSYPGAERQKDKYTAEKDKKPEKKSRPIWVWIVGIIAVVILCAVIGYLIRPLPNNPATNSDGSAVQPEQEIVVETRAPVTGVEAVQPEVMIEPESQVPLVEPEQVVVESSYLARAMTGEFSGTQVDILGRITDQELLLFDESMNDFEDSTGIRVSYLSHNTFNEILDMRIEAGDPPDIVDMPQPSLLADLASDGRVVDVSQFLDKELLQSNYNQSWLDLITMESPNGPIMVGVWHRATNKSVVWYPKKEFAAAGYKVPATWRDLMDLTQQIADDGATAWCIGIESDSATGWVATDWVENILIRTVSPSTYDQWIAGKLHFSSPEVKRAVEIMSDIWFIENFVYGGREAILSTHFSEAAAPMFNDPPGCWLHLQGPWITLYFPDGLEPGVDYDFFTLPQIDESYGTPIIVYGNIMAMFNDRPEVRALMEYFSGGDSMEVLVRNGAFISPHQNSDLEWYANDVERRVAETVLDAHNVRFDASDMMPPEVGAGSFWTGMTDYVAGEDLNNALEMIDQSWP